MHDQAFADACAATYTLARQRVPEPPQRLPFSPPKAPLQAGFASPFREAGAYGQRSTSSSLAPVDTGYNPSMLRMGSKGSPFASAMQDAAFARASSMMSAASGLQHLSSTDLGLPSMEEYMTSSPLRLAALQSAFAQGPQLGNPA